ncbi:MAG: glycosyl hydrolase 115 family protein [Lachnospiraceae bacterium]|nr:glycosyl hydrolase 115 family protein [Lachnospiraceae bacterium]
MNSFNLFHNGIIANILCENQALKGIKMTAGTIAEDLFLVTGKKPEIINQLEGSAGSRVIIAATIGHSSLIDNFAEKDFETIRGKRECFIIKAVENPFDSLPHIKQALLVIGSDKRGTIYGMFRLSELCGVSPLIFWGDAEPEKKNEIILEFANPLISKEPSVKYRGFFINDEWPAFGKWCTRHYGDVNAKAYKMVFELVLRLYGNYLWPAMWKSSFWQDGPGIESARLADEYGVIIGTSHHEPLCRAGVEWQEQYQNYSEDNTWSFSSNSEAITQFWKDGILRSKDFENIITIGMRGESDSYLLGEDATLKDNIEILKKALTVQNQLIKDHVNHELSSVPRMFAIYKEVEDFYFGTEDCEGLDSYSELEDVILLLGDDNYGNLRAVPNPEAKPRPGGYGIYYHFDYHGGPFSYEWLNSTNLAKAWEQLTMAYEYGIREMWIVNVGDIKGNEYPLSFFMALAYDYEKWGINNLNSAAEYTGLWIDRQFGPVLSAGQKSLIHELLDSYTMWSSVRIPESLNPKVYKNNFHEIDTTFQEISIISKKLEYLRKTLPKNCLSGYESTIYFPARAFFNTMLINLAAGLNHLHAKRGTLAANSIIPDLKELISLDKHYITEFDKFLGGKWEHMMDSAHMCFTGWDDHDWSYPDIRTVCPIPQAKVVVSFRGSDVFDLGHHWQERPIIGNLEMTRPDVNAIILDIDSRGDVGFSFEISCNKKWLAFSQTQGSANLVTSPRTSVNIICDRTILKGKETALIQIDFTFVNGDKKQSFLNVIAGNNDYSCLYPCPLSAGSKSKPELNSSVESVLPSTFTGAYLEAQDYVCIPAAAYVSKTDICGMGFKDVPRLGRTGDAIKSFPVTKNWVNEEPSPYVRYDFVAGQTCEYEITFYFSPRNPLIKDGKIYCRFSLNENRPQLLNTIPEIFYAGHSDEEWCLGVTNNIRKITVNEPLNQGLNHLNFYAADPNAILENIVINPKEKPVPATHLAPRESYRVK